MDFTKKEDLTTLARAIRSRAANQSGTVYIIANGFYTKYTLAGDELTICKKGTRKIDKNLEEFLLKMEVEKDEFPILGYMIKDGFKKPSEYNLTETELSINVGPYKMFLRNAIYYQQQERELQGGATRVQRRA